MLKNFRFALLALLCIAFAAPSVAADWVDQINQKTYGAGQRVIYEMNVGSFTASGTFNAAEQQLSQLKNTGVDIIWLMPVYPRGGGINSPYAAIDFEKVNPAYGTIADLRSFVSAAHAKGMEVWLDWVPNHTATNATWVTTHPEYYTVQNGQMVHPNNYGDVYQLNYANTALQQAMTSCLKFWIDKADIDGYRCDFVSSSAIPTSYWQTVIPAIKRYKSDKTITFLGEADFGDITRLQQSGFEYDYAWGFQSRLENFGAAGQMAAPLRAAATTMMNENRATGRMLYLTNHDQNYNYSRHTLTEKYGLNRYLLTVFTYTLPGLPMIYNGEETGGNQTLDYFQDTKIDWTQHDPQMLNTLRTLAALKHSQAALHDGTSASANASMEFLPTTNNSRYILAYKRTSGQSEVIVILNPSTDPQTCLLKGITGTYSLWLNSSTIAQGASRKQQQFHGSLSTQVPAKGYLVYVKGSFSDEALPEEKPLDSLVDEDKYSVYYETPVDNAIVCAWMWGSADDGSIYSKTGSWPGDRMTRLGKTREGNIVYKLAFDVPEGSGEPTNIIITENGSDDASKTVNGAPFVNHGYYVKGSTAASYAVPTGIRGITIGSIGSIGHATSHGATSYGTTSHGTTSHGATSYGATSHGATSYGTTSYGATNTDLRPFVYDPAVPVYNIAGQRVGSTYRGIAIQRGHKIIIK